MAEMTESSLALDQKPTRDWRLLAGPASRHENRV
jgi:hypothetical protein